MYGLLNLGSLLLGLMAWILPLIKLIKKNKKEDRSWPMFVFISIGACAVSLFLQILYRHHLQIIEDWSAIMDTSFGVVFVSSVLLIVTLVLSALCLIAYRKASRK